MTKLETLPIFTSQPNSSQVNDGFAKITTALNNTLSRDGSTPNEMLADLDLNNNDLINVNSLNVERITLNGTPVVPTSVSEMADWKAVSAVVSSNVASTEVLFKASRQGALTNVVCILDDTPVSGTDALFSVIKRTSGGTETLLIDNSIAHAGAAFAVTEWAEGDPQIEVRAWSIGDLILVRCDGTGTAGRSAVIQIEYFEFN